MTIQEYTNTCKAFAADTNGWAQVDQYKFYTTNGDGWEESCDNANGGLDVSWAFSQPASKIERDAAQRFVDQLRELVALGRDDGWHDDQWDALLELME